MATHEDIAKRYPAFAEMMAIPEVADLLVLAQAQNWNAAEFQLHLHDTKWWKSTTDTGREWQLRKLTNPGQASQDMLRVGNKIGAVARAQGIHITLPQIQWISEAANNQGWTDDEITQNVLRLSHQGKQTAGLLNATQTQLRGVAADYGLPLSEHTAFTWARRIQSGQADQKGFEEYARNQAKLNHPYWGKQLDEGHSLRELADPYIQTASQLLEVSPDAIDLTRPRWQRALQQHTKDGVQPMSMLDWQRTLMTDPSYHWETTTNARDAAFDIVGQLEDTFGAR